MHAKEKTRTLISADWCRPEWRGDRGKARPIPELCRILRTFPVEARYFFEHSGHRANRTWEKCLWGTRFIAQIKAMNGLSLACRPSKQGERKTNHALHFSAKIIGWVSARLSTPLLISLNGTQISGHHDNTCGRNRVIGRVGVMHASHIEAAPASITLTKPWRGTICSLVHRGCEAIRGLTTRYQETLQSAWIHETPIKLWRSLPGSPQPL